MAGKIAEADVKEFISDFFWDDEAGPFENIFRWANRFLIVFSKGPLFIVGIALTAAGLDFSKLGRMIDKKYGLRDLSDISKVSSDQVGKDMSGMLMDEVEKSLGIPKTSSLDIPLTKQAQEPSEETVVERRRRAREKESLEERRLRLQEERLQEQREARRERAERAERQRTEREEREGRQRAERAERERKREEERAERGEAERRREEAREGREQKRTEEREEKERTRREERQEDIERKERQREEARQEREEKEKERQRERRKQEKHQLKMEKARAKSSAKSLVSSGKLSRGALGFGIGGLVGWVVKSLFDPKSMLSKALKGAGVVGAEEFAERREKGRERREVAPKPSLRQPTTNLKVRLEKKIDQILQ